MTTLKFTRYENTVLLPLAATSRHCKTETAILGVGLHFARSEVNNANLRIKSANKNRPGGH